jgi:hypothetical protein
LLIFFSLFWVAIKDSVEPVLKVAARTRSQCCSGNTNPELCHVQGRILCCIRSGAVAAEGRGCFWGEASDWLHPADPLFFLWGSDRPIRSTGISWDQQWVGLHFAAAKKNLPMRDAGPIGIAAAMRARMRRDPGIESARLDSRNWCRARRAGIRGTEGWRGQDLGGSAIRQDKETRPNLGVAFQGEGR